MADLFVWWDQDLVILPTGDLLVCEGTIEGEQRVMRRLLTPPASYIWHPEYGAGLPQYIGQPVQPDAVGALILAQMLIEDAVAQSPLPVVTVEAITNGLQANIKYVDNNVGTLVSVGFNVNA
jgi:phage baseplate assembly protein W